MKFNKKVILGGVVLSAAAINHWVFKNAEKKVVKSISDKYYKWRFGVVRYIVKGEGEPLLLLHGVGIGCSLFEWKNNMDMLSKYYKVYAIDLLGFGLSDKPKMTYTSYLYVTLINDFIEDVIKEKVNVVGSSASGEYVVMAYKFKPDLYNKMMLISPTGITENTMNINLKLVKELIELPIIGTSIYNFASSRINCKDFLRSYCFGDINLVNEEIVDEYYYTAHYGSSSARFPIASFVGNFLTRPGLEHNIKEVKIPLHILWGDKNEFHQIPSIMKEEEFTSNFKLTIMEGCRLLPHNEKPREFLKICKKFFG